jgi:hypothetical protein
MFHRSYETYWLFDENPRGDVVKRTPIFADSDEDAIRLARELRGREAASLWVGVRNVMGFPATDAHKDKRGP